MKKTFLNNSKIQKSLTSKIIKKNDSLKFLNLYLKKNKTSIRYTHPFNFKKKYYLNKIIIAA